MLFMYKIKGMVPHLYLVNFNPLFFKKYIIKLTIIIGAHVLFSTHKTISQSD